MKYLSAILLCSVSISLTAQTTNSFPTDGNVGIGTTSPEEKLQVNGALLVEMQSNYSPDPRIIFNNDGTGANLYQTFYRWTGTASNYYATRFYESGNQGFKIQTSSTGTYGNLIFTDALTLMRNGNLGIGTSNPMSKLHINDGKMRVSGGTDRIYLDVDDANSKSVIGFGDDFGDRLDILFDYWNGTSSDLEVMSLLSNGNVGIGTTSPDAKLAVKGSIHAEEVKVDLSVPGPDYVFKEGYDFKSLEEVQNYIKQNGHLPNIPSAKEMEENGIQLGEMNMKLLEKIEELTLYTLEQEKKLKRMESLELELDNQKKEIEELKTLIINLQK